jgi:transposase-like protein
MHIVPERLSEPRGSRRVPIAERTAWVERFHQSGLSQRAFARQHGLKLGLLLYWIYGHKSAVGTTTANIPRFQEIRLAPSEPSGGWAAEIRLPDGTLVRLDHELARALVPSCLHRR